MTPAQIIEMVERRGAYVSRRPHGTYFVQFEGANLEAFVAELAAAKAQPEAAQAEPAEDAALMEAVLDAADEWAQYVEADTAPMTLRKYLERAKAEAERKSAAGGKKAMKTQDLVALTVKCGGDLGITEINTGDSGRRESHESVVFSLPVLSAFAAALAQQATGEPAPCRHEAYQGRCVHCDAPFVNGIVAPKQRASESQAMPMICRCFDETARRLCAVKRTCSQAIAARDAQWSAAIRGGEHG